MAGSPSATVWKVGAVGFALLTAAATLCAYRLNEAGAALRGQLADAQHQIAALKRRLAIAESRIEADSQRLALAQQEATDDQQKIVAESRPDLPIKLWFRHVPLTQGETAYLQNLTTRSLEVVLDVESAATGQRYQHSLVVNPGLLPTPWGPRQGWAFASGQRVTLTNMAYRPLVQSVSQ
jgi:hypothetical protein